MKIVPLTNNCEDVSIYTEYLGELSPIVRYSPDCPQLSTFIYIITILIIIQYLYKRLMAVKIFHMMDKLQEICGIILKSIDF